MLVFDRLLTIFYYCYLFLDSLTSDQQVCYVTSALFSGIWRHKEIWWYSRRRGDAPGCYSNFVEKVNWQQHWVYFSWMWEEWKINSFFFFCRRKNSLKIKCDQFDKELSQKNLDEERAKVIRARMRHMKKKLEVVNQCLEEQVEERKVIITLYD